MRFCASYDNHLSGKIKVFVDGRDITNECYEFDTEEGWADCYVFSDPERFNIDPATGRQRSHRLRGTITTIPPVEELPNIPISTPEERIYTRPSDGKRFVSLEFHEHLIRLITNDFKARAEFVRQHSVAVP